MHWIDWTILIAYLLWIVWDGLRLTKKSQELEGYFLASRSIPWWAVGLSVMATQHSANTMTAPLVRAPPKACASSSTTTRCPWRC
jgi:Na+/proline symporter